MDQESNLKLLFVSASPVLVNEVKRFYIDLKSHLSLQLEKRRAKMIAQEERKGNEELKEPINQENDNAEAGNDAEVTE